LEDREALSTACRQQHATPLADLYNQLDIRATSTPAAGWKIGGLPEQHRNDKIVVYPVPNVVMKIDEPINA
jgi:hypothetical protein